MFWTLLSANETTPVITVLTAAIVGIAGAVGPYVMARAFDELGRNNAKS